MGTRTGTRGNQASSYTVRELDAEIARVQMRLRILTPSKAVLRKQFESRLHNLKKERAKKGEND